MGNGDWFSCLVLGAIAYHFWKREYFCFMPLGNCKKLDYRVLRAKAKLYSSSASSAPPAYTATGYFLFVSLFGYLLNNSVPG